jgi:hypothetical protein
LTESLEILTSKYYIKIEKVSGGMRYSPIQLYTHGFIQYAETFLRNYPEMFKSIISAIHNENICNSKDIAFKTGCKRVLVNILFDYFNERDYVIKSRALGTSLVRVTPQGKRYFREVLSQ